MKDNKCLLDFVNSLSPFLRDHLLIYLFYVSEFG